MLFGVCFQLVLEAELQDPLEGFQSVPDLKREIQVLQDRIVELEKKLSELRKGE